MSACTSANTTSFHTWIEKNFLQTAFAAASKHYCIQNPIPLSYVFHAPLQCYTAGAYPVSNGNTLKYTAVDKCGFSSFWFQEEKHGINWSESTLKPFPLWSHCLLPIRPQSQNTKYLLVHHVKSFTGSINIVDSLAASPTIFEQYTVPC